jgi:subtilisin family serine protease
MHRAAVHVIVEMNDPSPSARFLSESPQLQSLLASMRAHLLDVLRAAHARNVYAFHLIPAIAATVAGADLPGLLAQPGVRAIVLNQWRRLLPAPGAASTALAAAAAGAGPNGVRRVVDMAQTVEPESFDLTRANVAQAHGYDGDGVRVAVIDSGLDVTQPDLAGTLATDVRGVPLRVDFTGTDLQDAVGHGTACASLIAAQGRVLYTADTLFQARSAPPQSITGGRPLILLPGQTDVLHASATVPLSMQPGTYHVRLFVYTVFGNQVAVIPLTVVVEARTGIEPSLAVP